MNTRDHDPSMKRHRRLHLAIFAAAAILALNAFAVAQGWSPFQVPGEQPRADGESQPASAMLIADSRAG